MKTSIVPSRSYIQLILPLKLGWEPYYSVEEGTELEVGDRVKAEFAHREYIGVVSCTGANPKAQGVSPESVKSIIGKEDAFPKISAREIAFWKQISSYYLCTVGEVYKAAYPAERTAVKAPRKKSPEAGTAPSPVALSPILDNALEDIHSAFKAGRTVLLEGPAGSGKTQLYLKLAEETLSQGRSVLLLVPEIALSRQLEERVRKVFPQLRTYHSALTPASRRLVGKEVREGIATIVLGTRSSLFLPYKDLGLVIVDEEHDTSYKQTSPAPRYNTRETAIMLSSVHGANVILGSATPSLESLYNADKGIFTSVKLKHNFTERKDPGLFFVNTSAEQRKNGMSGSFSLKLLTEMKEALDAGDSILLVCRAKAAATELSEEVSRIFPDSENSITITTPSGIKLLPGGSFALTAILQADSLLGKDDFRADEHTLQLLQQLLDRSVRSMVIQTRESNHPVFKALKSNGNAMALLPERRAFGYPPVTRLVRIEIKDYNEKRLQKLSVLLSRELSTIKAATMGNFCFLLPRDKTLHAKKQSIYKIVEDFERKYHYSSHIVIDVDPV
ncbi:MAG: DEAD/DEAH box helicase [Bacteroidales bacterium]|nr:DEAD/DEAH box helicase [Bacteroidales bacterium]